MIRSMTGYGRFDVQIDGAGCSVETRCVNGRHLELSTRLPREWSDKEGLIRETVRELVQRGSLNIYIRRDETPSEHEVRIDVELARSYVSELRKLAVELHIEPSISVSTLVQIPAIFHGKAEEQERPDVWPELQKAIRTALTAMNAMRDSEGAALAADLTKRLESIREGLLEVERRSIERIPRERDRLHERVKNVLGEATLDESRLALEIVLIAEKLDVSEECVRLRSHLDHFVSFMNSTEQAGRKLNFLLQEMNREVNTIGSKTNDAEIALIVVGMKEELERIREQVQNVE